MEEAKSTRERMMEARQLEQGGQFAEAASVYQKIVDRNAGNEEAVGRLLVMYRKLKDYRKELAAIDEALEVYAQRDKDQQVKWIKEHPRAAGAGRSILKKLGGASASAFGANPLVSSLQKRKKFVNKRLAGKRGKVVGMAKKKAAEAGTVASAVPGKTVKRATNSRKEMSPVRKKVLTQKATEQQKREARKRKDAEARRRAAATAARKKEAKEKREVVAARKAQALAAKKAERDARLHPSLFIISLRYLAPLEKIDAAMPQHMAFLNKHYEKGDFLVSGRQAPRTGGIIIARGKDRDAVERLIKVDPLVKKKLASVDITEFIASQVGKGWKV